MDAAWPLLAKTWASTVLGARLTAMLATFASPFEAPPGGQEHGWFIYMNKDLRGLLRMPLHARYAVRYCGGGSLTRCRELLWSAIDQAGNALAAAQGPDPANWHSPDDPRIHFVPGLLPTTMRYTNRPSGIQQVLSFSGHSPSDTGR